MAEEGYAIRLDEARLAGTRARDAVEELQTRYVAETGVKSLRIRVNTLVGYHVEVLKALGESFTLRQGLASFTRFSTAKLNGLAARLEVH